MSWKSGEPKTKEIYFEFVPIGNQVRVNALDAASGTEVMIIAPANASEDHMKKVAGAKLMRALANQQR